MELPFMQDNSPPSASPFLALYVRDWCGYCSRVKRVLDRLELNIPLRNTSDPEHRQVLLSARGRLTVPVLRLTDADGKDTWMPESRDIMTYLEQQHG